MIKINYKSDFKINESSETVAMEVPFVFSYYVFDSKKYVVSFDGHNYVNCERKEDGSLDVIFNQPEFGIGHLKVERKYAVDDKAFADGVFDVVTVDKTDVFITSGQTFETYVKTLVVPPYLKGDKGDPMTWETMTEKERGELVKDVAEAIDPEMVMTENEKSRQEAEQSRQTAEQQRSTTFNTLKGEMQSAITAGNEAAKNAQKVVDEYDTKVSEQDSKLTELGSELGLLIEKVGVSGLRVFSGDKITIDVTHLNTDNINRNYLSMFVYPFSLGNNKLNISNIGLYTFVADKDGYLAVEKIDAEIKYYATTSSYYLERLNEIDKKISKEEENELKNLAKGGNFKDLNYWNSVNGSVVEGGLSLTDARNILLESKFTEETFLGDFFSVLIDLESVTQNTQTFRFSLYKNAYINEAYFEVVGGRQVLCVQTNKNNMGDIDGGKIFLNITKGMPFNGIIHSIIVIRNVNSELAYELYKKYGFFERVKMVGLSEFCINAPTLEAFNNVKDKVEYNISEHTHTIQVYLSDTSVAENIDDGIFVGTKDNINALQRAIDSIPNDTEDYWTIYVEGNIKAKSFSELSAADVFGRDYKSLVSLAGKRNISIIGINGQPKIEVELPDNDKSVDYSLYQTLSLEGENIYVDNLFVSIKNGRYAVHYETNDSKIGDLFKNATVRCNRCSFTHQGNSGEAYVQWKSLYGIGIGFTLSPKLYFENCKFSSIGGHDGYNIEEGFLSTINCSADEWNFNQFGKERSRTSYQVVGCSYNKLVIRKTLNKEKIGYAHVDGYANSIKNIEYFDDNCKPNFSVSMEE